MDPENGPPAVRPISKGLYLGLAFGSIGAAFLLSLIGIAMGASGQFEAFAAAASISLLSAIVGSVVLLVLLYRIWAAIQGPDARTTPGKAVGFAFIPIFNFYWVFQIYAGWAEDYNKFANRLGLNAPRASEALGLTISILCLLSIIPYLGLLAALANMVLMLIFFNTACDAVNAIASLSKEEDFAPPAHAGSDPAVQI